ncbi:MAG: Uma2 family endonuclease, partial [Bacteroidetes bacterium]
MLEIIENLSVLTDCKFELIEGQIYPKEGSDPILQAVIDYILSPNFDINEIHKIYDMPRTSISHKELMRLLSIMIIQQIDISKYAAYFENMEVNVSAFGAFRIPDVTFTLLENTQYNEFGQTENPISIIEVLSPATEEKDRNQKKIEYQNNENLQEYVLISQDSYKIEQFLR